jgi:hypothetical protein
MWRGAVAALMLGAVAANDVSGGQALAAARAWGRERRDGLVDQIEQRIGRSRTQEIVAAANAAVEAARAKGEQGASALLSIASGERGAERKARIADQQISEGGGVKIVIGEPRHRHFPADAGPANGGPHISPGGSP